MSRAPRLPESNQYHVVSEILLVGNWGIVCLSMVAMVGNIIAIIQVCNYTN